MDVLPDDVQRGRHPASQSRQPDEADSEPEEPRVHDDLPQTRHAGRHEHRDRLERGGGEGEAAGAAQGRDHGALGQQLPQQAAASAADRHPHCKLGSALRAARQHQVRDVDARYHQDEQHRALQQQQTRPHPFDLPRLQRDHASADIRVRTRVLFGEPGRDGVHLYLCFGERHLRAQPSHHAPPAGPAARSLVLRERLRQEEVAFLPAALEAQLEVRTEHADHGVGLSFQHQRAPDDVRLAPEPALPQSVRQDDHAAARQVLVRQERATVSGVDAQHLEEALRDKPSGDFRLACAAEVERPGIHRRRAFETPHPIAPVQEIRGTDRHRSVPVVRIGLPERYEAFRLGEAWRLEKHGVDDGEDGRRRADCQRQRQDRGGGEPGMPAQQPQAVRTSRSPSPSAAPNRDSRTRSLVGARPPRAASACRRASSGGIPRARRASISRATWCCSSSSSSWSARFPSRSARSRARHAYSHRSKSMPHASVRRTTWVMACDSRSQFAVSCSRYRRPGGVSE